MIKNIIICLSVLIAVTVCGVNAFAESLIAPSPDGGYTRRARLETDYVFKGVFAEQSLYFSALEHEEITGLDVDIYYKMTQLAMESFSALTLTLNGVPFQSIRLSYSGESERHINLKIPLTQLNTGKGNTNELKFESYLRIDEAFPCVDDVTSANWLTIFGDTAVNVHYVELPLENSIAGFSALFTSYRGPVANIAVSDAMDAEEIAAGAKIIPAVAQINKNVNFTALGKVKTSGQNILYIGKARNTPPEILAMLPDGIAAIKGKCAVVIGDSPYDAGAAMMAVIADDEANFIDAIHAVATEQTRTQLKGGCYYFGAGEYGIEKERQPVTTRTLTFGELGLDDSGGVTLTGPFQRSYTTSLKLPHNAAISGNSSATLNIRYSGNLDFDRSLVTVLINGTPIGSGKLYAAGANGDSLFLEIPPTIKTRGYVELTVAFDLEMKDMWCTKRREMTPWAYISPDSTVILNTNHSETLLFDYYPYPFIKDARWNKTLFVTSQMDADNPSELKLIGEMIAFLSGSFNAFDGEAAFCYADELDENYADYNIIAIGSHQNNEMIRAANSRLFFRYDDSGSFFLGNEKLYLQPDYSAALASAQLMVSPYNAARAALFITAPEAKKLPNIIKYFSRDEEFWKVTGDCLLDDGENMLAYRFKFDSPDDALFLNPTTLTSAFSLSLLAGSALIMLLVIVVFIYIKYKRSKL